MDKDAPADLFPWILGCLLVAVAVPAVFAVTKPAAAPVPILTATITPVQPSSIAAAPAPSAVPTVPTVPAQQATQPALPAGQVWQCVVSGQKVFSDTACGDGASIRQLSDVNGMQPTPVARAPRYPGYGPYPGYDPNPGYAPPVAYPGAPTDQDGSSAADMYVVNQVAIIDGRRRHEHFAPPPPHAHAAARGHLRG